MFNLVAQQGRLVKDPELRKTTSGTSVCSFTIAVDGNFKDKQADFFNCIAWKNTADFVSKYFHKGSSILVKGELHNRSYEKDGSKRVITEITANEVYFCGAGGTGGGSYNSHNKDISSGIAEGDYVEIDDSDGDLPF